MHPVHGSNWHLTCLAVLLSSFLTWHGDFALQLNLLQSHTLKASSFFVVLEQRIAKVEGMHMQTYLILLKEVLHWGFSNLRD